MLNMVLERWFREPSSSHCITLKASNTSLSTFSLNGRAILILSQVEVCISSCDSKLSSFSIRYRGSADIERLTCDL